MPCPRVHVVELKMQLDKRCNSYYWLPSLIGQACSASGWQQLTTSKIQRETQVQSHTHCGPGVSLFAVDLRLRLCTRALWLQGVQAVSCGSVK